MTRPAGALTVEEGRSFKQKHPNRRIFYVKPGEATVAVTTKVLPGDVGYDSASLFDFIWQPPIYYFTNYLLAYAYAIRSKEGKR